MLGKFFECEANKDEKYYRVIQTVKEYPDGKRFPINEIVVADKKINFEAKETNEMGGFCVSTYDCVFRWLIRGDTLCEVTIPENEKIYRTTSKNGIYIAEKIILKNPQKINDTFAMKLYLSSKLPEESYFKAMTACAICGYLNTANRVFKDKVNKDNVDFAISEMKEFCKRRVEEKNYIEDYLKIESVKTLYNRLKQVQKN